MPEPILIEKSIKLYSIHVFNVNHIISDEGHALSSIHISRLIVDYFTFSGNYLIDIQDAYFWILKDLYKLLFGIINTSTNFTLT